MSAPNWAVTWSIMYNQFFDGYFVPETDMNPSFYPIPMPSHNLPGHSSAFTRASPLSTELIPRSLPDDSMQPHQTPFGTMPQQSPFGLGLMPRGTQSNAKPQPDLAATFAGSSYSSDSPPMEPSGLWQSTQTI